MNPQTPNPYGTPDAGADTVAAPPPHEPVNPYLQQAQAAPTPDLDAQAPLLRASDVQRLNRKALGFLAGIVLLLVLMATWVFAGGRDDEKKVAKPSAEAVSIPELPQAAAGPVAPAEPIAVEGYGAGSAGVDGGLPPLPPADPDMGGSQSYGASAAAVPPPAPRPPSLMERRMGVAAGDPANVDGAAEAYGPQGVPGMPGAPVAAAPARAAGSARVLQNPDGLLVRGTYIRCVLETHIVTDIPGFTSCVVTEPVYSINGRRLLLPKGSKVSGRYQDTPNGPRVSVVWDRITTPNGIDVNMASPGVDGLGGAGHPGDYDAHWGSRIASALMISLVSDAFKYAAAKNGPPTVVSYGTNVVEMPFESNTARTMERLAQQALEAGAARRPTVTIHQGTVVNVYVARDIDFTGVLASR
ncbi:TrbI/VirB10 family protein [Lysobacter humi (ex Lee et al. 2017)]